MTPYLFLLFACNPGQVTDREPGERAPLTAPCDDADLARCLLPWPSSRYSAVDDGTATGLRLAVEPDSLPIPDRVDFLNLGDGFSRVTGVTTVLEGEVDPGLVSWDPADSLSPASPLQVLVAEPDHPDYGRRLAFRTELHDVSDLERDRWLLVGRPVEVLPADAEHVVVVLRRGDEQPNRDTLLALDLADPRNRVEADLVGYHAPTRQLLDDVGLDPEDVLRVWDFTTRSAEDPHHRLAAMIDALDDAADELEVELDYAVLPTSPDIALLLRGRLLGAPSFLDADGHMVLDHRGLPEVVDEAAIEFRIMVPAATEDYRVVLYGHGTGGGVNDDAFDDELAAHGIAKVNLRYDGWTGEDVVHTLLGFTTFLDGSDRSTAGLLQALAGGTALLTALDGPLGELMSAESVWGEDNPVAGLAPRTDDVAWVGGSMGGTMGAVLVSADDRFHTAVLNVPGSGWTHMVPYSDLFRAGLGTLMAETYGNPLDLQLGMVMAQGCWDDVDGAVWAEQALAAGGTFLMQESMGDPILPNLGTELLANALGAVQLEPKLEAVVGLESTDGVVTEGAALEQFHVPDTGKYDVHGFAARDTPAGEAALDQILSYLESAWAGEPVMEHAPLCVELVDDGSCDFSEMWE